MIASSERQLGDEKFISRAPAHVVDTIREKLAGYQAQLAEASRITDMSDGIIPRSGQLIELALREDIGSGDITSAATIPADRMAQGRFYARQDPRAGRRRAAADHLRDAWRGG